MHKVLLVSLLLTVISLFGCEEEIAEVDIDFGYSYFPMEVGAERIYQIDSISFREQGTIVDSSSSQLRELIVGLDQEDSTGTTFLMEQYERPDTSAVWTLKRTLSVQRTDQYAVRQVGNRFEQRLVFPTRVGATWSATRFFDGSVQVQIAGNPIEYYKGWSPEITARDVPFTLDGRSYPQTLQVQSADFGNIIELRHVREVYARELGLIYRELQVLDTQCQTCCAGDLGQCAIPWQEKAEKGLILQQRIINP